MSLDMIKLIITKIKGYAHGIYLHVKGEPLIHPEIVGILQFLKEEDVNVKLTTNGTLIKELGDVIIQMDNIHHINISLQASNTFTKIKKDEYFDNLFLFLNKINNTYVYLRDWVHDNDTFERLKTKYPTLKKINGYKITDYIIYSFSEEFKWPEIDDEIVKKGPCLGGKMQLGILVNGDVVLCCLDPNGYTKVGNIIDQSMDEILNSKLYKESISKMPYFELCKRCSFRLRFLKEEVTR